MVHRNLRSGHQSLQMGIRSGLGLLRAFLTGAAFLFIIITCFSLLIPSRAMVSRAVQIDGKPASFIYQQVADLNRWVNWHPVFTTGPATLDCPPSGPLMKERGCTITQGGKKINIRLLSSDSNAVRFLLTAPGENDVENEILVRSADGGESVQVEWKAIMKLKWYPWQKVYGIFIDPLTGPGYEAALKGLKDYMEEGHHPASPATPPARDSLDKMR
jgi:hypothetical protein